MASAGVPPAARQEEGPQIEATAKALSKRHRAGLESGPRDSMRHRLRHIILPNGVAEMVGTLPLASR